MAPRHPGDHRRNHYLLLRQANKDLVCRSGARKWRPEAGFGFDRALGASELLLTAAAWTVGQAAREGRQRVTCSVETRSSGADDGAARQPYGSLLRLAAPVFGATRRRSPGMATPAWRLAAAMARSPQRVGSATVAGDLQLRAPSRSIPGSNRRN